MLDLGCKSGTYPLLDSRSPAADTRNPQPSANPDKQWTADLMRRRMSARDGKLGVMSSVEQPEEPVVRTYTPDEAIRRARPLPSRDRLVIEDVPEDEWAAFQAALAGA